MQERLEVELSFSVMHRLIDIGARLCYSEALSYAMKRTTFGKRLIEHQIIRFKLAEMVRMV